MDHIVHGIAKSQTQLSDLHLLTQGKWEFSGKGNGKEVVTGRQSTQGVRDKLRKWQICWV